MRHRLGVAQARPSTIISRLAFVSDLVARLYDASDVCRGYRFMPTARRSTSRSSSTSMPSAAARSSSPHAVRAEGVDLNPHYKYLVCEWPYMQPHLADDFDTPNARSIRDRSFNLYLNENYREQESRDFVKAIVKVEKYLKKRKQPLQQLRTFKPADRPVLCFRRSALRVDCR